MAMSAGGGGGGVKAEPNVTPMIDVMLVLLIIFMVVTPALLAGFNAVPPQGQNLKDHPEDAENDQVLGIDRDGNYYLNKKPIAKTAVEAEIKRIYESRTVDYHARLRTAFLAIADAEPRRCIVVDAFQSVDQIARDIKGHVDARMRWRPA